MHFPSFSPFFVAMIDRPRFGTKIPGCEYIVRPGVYAVILHSGRLITAIETRQGLFLPGGGIESGESEFEALERELMEELGATAEIGELIGQADEYWSVPSRDLYVDKQALFYRVHLKAIVGAGQHPSSLVTVEEFAANAVHQSQSWAVELTLGQLRHG